MSGSTRDATAPSSPAQRSLAALRERSAPGPEADWIGSLRREAWEAFVASGLPTRRLEAWKGTSLARLEAMDFDRVGPAGLTATDASAPAGLVERAAQLVFVDGRLDPTSCDLAALPPGCRLRSLAELRREAPEELAGRLAALTDPKSQPLVALQTAFLDDGAVLSLDPGTVLEVPIALLFLSTGGALTDATGVADATGTTGGIGACFPRLLVVAGEGSEARLYQEHRSTGAAPGLTACVAEIHVGASARVEHVQVQDESAARVHFTSTHARLERDARLDSHVFTLGSGLVRSELEVVMTEPGAETRMHGFYLGRGEGHVDHYTTAEHAAPHCRSDEEYRGVLGDRSRGVFRGRVVVRPDAQKTDARQSNPNLLISDRASIDTKPQLEIYADDVRASHGSTIGQLDPDALFFLRARGIAEEEARLLLTRGFAETIVDAIASDAIRQRVSRLTDAELRRVGREVR